MTDSVRLGRMSRRRQPPEAFAQRLVALHRQPVELDREDVDQHVADDEHRHREAQHREAHHERGRSTCPGGRRRARRAARRSATDSTIVVSDSMSVGSMRSPTSEATVFLKKNDSPKSPRAMLPSHTKNCVTIGSSRPSFSADVGDVLRRGGRACDDRCRIAGREPQQREDEDRDDRHDGDRREETLGDVGEHRDADAVGKASALPGVASG